MSFTSANLITLETAIMTLASGAEEVSINGRRYKKANLKELRDLYDWMKGKVNETTDQGLFRGTFAKTSNQDDN